MKIYPIELSLISLLLFVPMLIFGMYGNKLFGRAPQPAPISAINLVLRPSVSDATPTILPTYTPPPTETPTNSPTPSPTQSPTSSPTPSPTETATLEPTAAPLDPTNTPTFGEMMKDRIVFYLIQPEKGREDACGDIQVIPIISKRLRSGDKLDDVQVALNMLFSLKRKIYIQWYNALWDTDFTIENYQYNAKKDYMTIQFGGYFPYTKLSSCDKHGIREQIWTTFFHYGFKEKTFKVSDGFLIDRLGGN